MFKILVVEEPVVAPMVVEALSALLNELNGEYDIILAISETEAVARLDTVDMAIINVDDIGRDVAYRAVNKTMVPVIALTTAEKFSVPRDTESLCFVLKPEFSVERFRRAVLKMISAISARKADTAFERYGFSRN